MKSALALLIALGATTGLAAQESDLGPPPGRMVDVGGRKLHLNCTGAGSPTIVLEAGASAFAIDWTLVQQEVARTNRVCSYDRAGSGWSDSTTATTRSTVEHDLHSLLEVAGEKPPYILVGASLGGIFVRLYQAEYPDQVVGMVLIDAAAENRLFAMFQGQAVTIASLSAEQLRSTIPIRDVRVPRRSPQTGAPFDQLPPALYQQRIKLDAKLIASIPDIVPYDVVLESAERQRAQLARLLALSVEQPHPLGDRPLVVLTRGREWSQGLQDAHAALAGLSTNSRQTVVAGAGHEIHLFEPKAVILAITDVVEASRTKTRLPSRSG
jgi:pimeloyl-ACP methyl ester carboxylesterase